jgi:hypothetical protein
VTIIRIMSKSGGMNPLFGTVDIVPDEDLNKRLKFYVGFRMSTLLRSGYANLRFFQCEYVVESFEEDFIEVFSKEVNKDAANKELCNKRSKICERKQIKTRRDEL